MKIGNLIIGGRRVIGEDASNPLLIRWIIFCHPALFGLYIHKLCRSDHARALHDHPWWFWTFILKNPYYEIARTSLHCRFRHATCIEHPVYVQRRLKHHRFQLLFRPAQWRHRVVIDGKPAWTLVLRGPTSRKWGFWPKGNFCYWRKYDGNTGVCNDVEIHGEDKI